MNLGWDRCGYQSVEELEPGSDADGLWASPPPPSPTRGERASLLRFGPVRAVPGNAIGRTRGHWRYQHGSQNPPGDGTGDDGNGRVGLEAVGHVRWGLQPHESVNGAERGRGASSAAAAAPVASRAVETSPYFRERPGNRARFLSEGHKNHATRPSSVSAATAAAAVSFMSIDEGPINSTRDGRTDNKKQHQRRHPLWRNVRWSGSTIPERRSSSSRRRRGVSEDLHLDSDIGPDRGWGWDPWSESTAISQVAFDPDFDTSRQHLAKLFNSLDTNGRGTVTFEAIRLGLGSLGTYSDVSYVLQRAEMEKSKEITLDDFIDTVRDCSTKMFEAKQEVPVSCFCYDYSSESVTFRWVKTGDSEPPTPFVSLRNLMAETRDQQQGDVRWVCLTGSNPSLVIHMANRYGIHPLQVEDCLNRRERLKVDAFRAPSKPVAATSTSGQGDVPGEGRAASSPTVSGGGKNASEDILHVVLARISPKSPTAGSASSFKREQVSIFLVGDHTVLFIEPRPSAISDQISNRIYYAGSKLRLNNARYLVYSLMDSIVDDVFPIMQHFQTWLVQLQGELHSGDDGPTLEIVRAIQQISRDMHMITYYLRPMTMVAAQLITDLPGSDADLKRHLEDLRDHLLMLEEQASRITTWSRSLNTDWVNEQQHRMNQVIYILTMVTSAFMPAQFLAGVFGMNFKFMPELKWRYSYASFWVLVALLAVTSYTVYKRQKWL